MRIGVMGAGAVGCFVGGRLLAARTADVVFVGRASTQAELARGMRLVELDGTTVEIPAARVELALDPSVLADVNAVLVTVKSGQTEAVAAQLRDALAAQTPVVSLQNGVRNAETLRGQLGARVIAGIVEHNVVAVGEGTFRKATDGGLVLEPALDDSTRALVTALRASHVPVKEVAPIEPHQWTKLLVNLNNAVGAISGDPTRELLLDARYRRIVAALLEEALDVLDAAGIRLANLRGVPPRIMPRVLRLPSPLARLVLRAQIRIDPEARSSMWQDLTRGRMTEVDYLNGEIVRLAEAAGRDAPLHRRLTELVHTAERVAVGSPALGVDGLTRALGM